MFERKKVISYESIFWRISGMRSIREYEILKRAEGAEISVYEMRFGSGRDMERHLMKRMLYPDEKLLELLNMCEVCRWDGFHGKHPKGVRDGIMFSFRAEINGGESIRAEGSENFPKHFREYRREIDRLLFEESAGGDCCG